MKVLLGLGGNTGDASAALARAARDLSRRSRLVALSSLWQTEPVGPVQPDYVNAALVLESEFHPLQLLATCRHLEAAAGRTPGEHWGPRPLDIDFLLMEGLVMQGPSLTVPHPRLAQRRFALLPASEVAPGWIHPRCHRTVAELAMACDPTGQRCRRIGPFPPLP
jgi:2-amino-4-hydroxy-6-hydroxymethyldihydropteridine diphosphokinase